MSVPSNPEEKMESPYAGVRVLVLGASGFIGHWVARRLAHARAHAVLAMRAPQVPAALTDSSCRFDLRSHLCGEDLSKTGSVTDLVKRIAPEVVFNLAGYGIDHDEREDALYRRINTELVRELAESMADLAPLPSNPKLRRIIHVGSALEYGTVRGDLSEDGPTEPTTVYGRSKLAGTKALLEIAEARNLPSVTARLFSIYGPGEHPARLLPSLLAMRGTDEVLPLTAGAQVRDFTYVEDVADGLLRLGLSEGPPGEVVNLATGTLTSVRTFIEEAAVALGIPRERLGFGELPTRGWEQAHEPLSLDRLLARTAWRPPTDLRDGLRRTTGLG